ncbi:MAG: hypothetical protein OXL96_09940 [Candidatus Poribacteria bacterium]|nr:hypothetical protein [Candidatus Poribacteria bacterium]
MAQHKIKRGQQVLDSDCFAFSAIDPFNPRNHVEGQISFSKDKSYGSLKIEKTNGELVDQPQIFGTPKIDYPFGLGHNYRFPSAERIYRIEQVHWTQTQTQLSATVIWATLLKAFENWENPELEEIIAILNEDYPIHQITISMGQIKQMFNTAKNAADTEKKIWELMIMHELDGNTDTATVFYKIANELDQDKRLVYKAIKNVQKMMKIEMNEYAS